MGLQVNCTHATSQRKSCCSGAASPQHPLPPQDNPPQDGIRPLPPSYMKTRKSRMLGNVHAYGRARQGGRERGLCCSKADLSQQLLRGVHGRTPPTTVRRTSPGPTSAPLCSSCPESARDLWPCRTSPDPRHAIHDHGQHLHKLDQPVGEWVANGIATGGIISGCCTFGHAWGAVSKAKRHSTNQIQLCSKTCCQQHRVWPQAYAPSSCNSHLASQPP